MASGQPKVSRGFESPPPPTSQAAWRTAEPVGRGCAFSSPRGATSSGEGGSSAAQELLLESQGLSHAGRFGSAGVMEASQSAAKQGLPWKTARSTKPRKEFSRDTAWILSCKSARPWGQKPPPPSPCLAAAEAQRPLTWGARPEERIRVRRERPARNPPLPRSLAGN